ncbi:hypothetical protein HK101_004069 [Irineochytrium annulatum]|nr:hypothetical protein HK101_004069 [Irineochytrium annulatum]
MPVIKEVASDEDWEVGEGMEMDDDDVPTADEMSEGGAEEDEEGDEGGAAKKPKTEEEKKMAREEQKKLAQERKASKPHAAMVMELKLLWNEMRQKKMDRKVRAGHLEKMMEMITGKIKEITMKHDAARIIQYGSTEQRNVIASELKGSYVALSCSKYGRFIVSKILHFCADYRSAVIEEFYTHVKRLMRHQDAAFVVEEAYSQFANATQKHALMEEFYGPQFALFKSTAPKPLRTLLEENPAKRPLILKHLRESLDHFLEKGSANIGPHTILHRALLDYLMLADPKAAADMVELLKDHLTAILHTREGARVAQLAILNSTPKDRKHILKSFKGLVSKIAREQYGHTVLITAFDCIDDTVMVAKAVLPELTAPPAKATDATVDSIGPGELMRDKYASRVLLFLFAGRSRRYQPAYVIEELEQGDDVKARTSKKEHGVRRKDLLTAASPVFMEIATKFCGELMRSKIGAEVLLEILRNASGDKTKLLAAVAAQCEGTVESLLASAAKPAALKQPFNAAKSLAADAAKAKQDAVAANGGPATEVIDMSEHVLVGRTSTFFLKDLIKGSGRRVEGGPLSDAPETGGGEVGRLAASLIADAIAPQAAYWVARCGADPRRTSGCAHVLAAVLESGEGEALLRACREGAVVDKLKGELAKWKGGMDVDVAPVEKKKRKRGGGKKKDEERPVGSGEKGMAGAEVLLQALEAAGTVKGKGKNAPVAVSSPKKNGAMAEMSRTPKAVAGGGGSIHPSHRAHLRRVAVALKRAKQCIAVTGAGISVSAGIPDFRSENGLYNLIKERYPNLVLKGKDLFDASIFRDATSTALFYQFMAELKCKVDDADITPTHQFLNELWDQGKLARWYTQNIDCLEARNNELAGSPTTAALPPIGKPLSLSNRANVLRSTQAPPTPASASRPAAAVKTPVSSTTAMPLTPTSPGANTVLIQLHGDLSTVICTLCSTRYAFTQPHVHAFRDGAPPCCPRCRGMSDARVAGGKRALAVGVLRPNVVLYGEHHPGGGDIADVVGKDVRRPKAKRVDVMMVMGTSLKVEGVKRLVRDLGKSVRGGGGIVVLVNRIALGKEWEDVFDVRIEGDCDDVVESIRDMWREAEGDDGGKIGKRMEDVRKVVKRGPGRPKKSGDAVASAVTSAVTSASIASVTTATIQPGEVSVASAPIVRRSRSTIRSKSKPSAATSTGVVKRKPRSRTASPAVAITMETEKVVASAETNGADGDDDSVVLLTEKEADSAPAVVVDLTESPTKKRKLLGLGSLALGPTASLPMFAPKTINSVDKFVAVVTKASPIKDQVAGKALDVSFKAAKAGLKSTLAAKGIIAKEKAVVAERSSLRLLAKRL